MLSQTSVFPCLFISSATKAPTIRSILLLFLRVGHCKVNPSRECPSQFILALIFICATIDHSPWERNKSGYCKEGRSRYLLYELFMVRFQSRDSSDIHRKETKSYPNRPISDTRSVEENSSWDSSSGDLCIGPLPSLREEQLRHI
jgi:hypothetical protein